MLERVAYSPYGVARHQWPADASGDGAVNSADLSIVLSSYGSITGSNYRSEADFNRDGDVDAADLAAVLSYAAALPEGALSSAGIANRTGYCGYRFAPETGMYLARNRWLSPPLGRWIQRDPLGYVDGMSYYQSGRSTPISGTDPSGLRQCFTSSINLWKRGVLCEGTDVEFEMCWSCEDGKLTVEGPRMLGSPNVPCDERFWDAVHTTVSLVLSANARHDFSVYVAESTSESCLCGPGTIQSVVIEARWVKTTSLGIGIGVSLGGLPLEIGVDDLIESIDRDKRGTQRHTFYCCNDPREEARLRGRSFRRYYESR